jgi:hypothetical protein
MLIFLIILLAVLVPIGIYQLCAYKWNFPSYNIIKYAKQSAHLGQKEMSKVEYYIEKIATPIAKKMKIDDVNKQNLEIALNVSDIFISPEMHIAKSIAIFIIFAVFSLPVFIFSTMFGCLILFAGIVLAITNYRSILIRLKKYRISLEAEVPKFATAIAEGLKNERDVLKLLTEYRDVAGPTFRRELGRTIADMKTSNYESALLRFDYRIGSSYLSDVIKGLLGAIRGDDQTLYFNLLCLNLKSFEKSVLMSNINKRPQKINMISLGMLLSIIVIYVVVLGTVMVDTISTFNL